MSRAMILGDTHDHASFVSNAHKAAREHEVDTIIQLGDFGFSFNAHMLASIQAWLSRDDSHRWFWIDGNHDQHDYIEQTILRDDDSGETIYHPHPVSHFHERMFYCPRGSTFRIGSTDCMALGGAFSIDKAYRKAHVSWWPQEMIRLSDMYRAYDNAEALRAAGTPVTVMFTHDAPPSVYLESWLDNFGYKVGPESLESRINLGRVVDAVRPATLFHGHYHERYRTVYETPEGWNVQVEGIGANLKWVPGRNTPFHQVSHPEVRENDNYLIREF